MTIHLYIVSTHNPKPDKVGRGKEFYVGVNVRSVITDFLCKKLLDQTFGPRK